MLDFGARRRRREAARAWHGEINRLARDPELYQSGLAQDTLDGRFEMVTLVTALVLRRLRDLGDPGRKLADSVYREVFSGLDHALREEGVGDASIARKVRGLGERFFGLARAVDAALGSEDEIAALTEVLARNGIISLEAGKPLSVWLVALAQRFAEAEPDKLRSGTF
ncbi:MAG: ubiquinol-cytochrome C chaperone family protein [Henriciella sp.]